MSKTSTPKGRPPTEAQAQQFDLLYPLVRSAYKEISMLSQKKQDGLVSEMKIRYINPLLVKARDLLQGDPVADFLDLLDEESTLQNSDAALVLGRFLSGMEQFRSRYYDEFDGWTTRRT